MTPRRRKPTRKSDRCRPWRVVKGEDFSKVAAEVSEDRRRAARRGHGKIPKGHNEAGFDEVAFNTKVNTVSPAFLDSLGWQFLKVTDSQPAGTVSLADRGPTSGRSCSTRRKRRRPTSTRRASSQARASLSTSSSSTRPRSWPRRLRRKPGRATRGTAANGGAVSQQFSAESVAVAARALRARARRPSQPQLGTG